MHYWIDGYNLLFRFPSQGTSLEEKREQLVKYMQNFAQLLKLQVTLVFDSGKQDIYARSHYKALEIIYTTPETTADHFLLDMISSSTTPQALC
ncbi:MAG: hypothetical protein FJZ58_04225, partial [Chlamydiae bacterium]|nr:hypothetical protein [Chlamydiota bacterium]